MNTGYVDMGTVSVFTMESGTVSVFTSVSGTVSVFTMFVSLVYSVYGAVVMCYLVDFHFWLCQ